MTDEAPPTPRHSLDMNLSGNILAGIFTVIPLFAVWFVLDLLFNFLSEAGKPIIRAFADWVTPAWPNVADLLLNPVVLSAFAVLSVLVILYFVGLLATFVIGQQLIALVERMIGQIPVVKAIYGSAKQLVGAIQTKPGNSQRVVLIAFPTPEMRAIGFVMKTFQEKTSGKEMAAVFVPTAPNPTSGYLELIAVDQLTATDMTMEQAMTMVLSGGTATPDAVRFGDERKE
ncbi:MAG: DUF502 domain-containing protein [Alphaproteobacteria bacterium]|nr:DUF502 domain-containing protein [Alphaproteobacteria bacterium]